MPPSPRIEQTGARYALRTATAEDHGRVDAVFSGYDLASEGGYRAMLQAQAAAFLPVEQALEAAGVRTWLADWDDRRRADLLREDLSQVGLDVPAPLDAPAYVGEAAVLGAAYVLEGSRRGSAILMSSLPTDAPRRFMGQRQPPVLWRHLVDHLDLALATPGALASAVASARGVFRLFEAAGRHYLEPVSR